MTNVTGRASTELIFLRALEVSPDQRGAYLAEVCGSNVELRREVESLLEHHSPETLAGGLSLRPQSPSSRLMTVVATGTRKVLVGRRRETVAWVLAASFLVGIGYWTRDRVQQSLRAQVGEQLRVVLDADVLALEMWINDCKREANVWAKAPALRAQAELLVRLAGGDAGKAELLKASPVQGQFRELFRPFMAGTPEESYALLIDRTGLRLAASRPRLDSVGRRSNERAAAFFVPVMEGQTRVSLASRIDSWALQRPTDSRVVSFVVAPVRDSTGNVIAALGLVRTDRQKFAEILNVARIGATGETYAISADGMMLSQSRFDEDLKKAGLLPDEPGASSILNVQVRDPGGDLTKGYKSAVELEARPFTHAASRAIGSQGKPPGQQTGVLLEPYRDYRGVEVVGAWRWLPEHGFGVITEVDAQEAFTALHYVSLAFQVLFGLLAGFVGLTLLASVSLARMRNGGIELGPYTLLKEIGEGGMSKVYLARHALLQRPTAVKVLKLPTDETTQDAIIRFEREVHAASRLTHPNTIEIYDVGQTPDGTLYYAMEYLPGLTLADLVSLEGSIQPARVIHILKQVCASLREAHHLGFLHRDIKPANIMLCERGGEYDFTKVLDFGLVRELWESTAAPHITAPGRIIGTLLYMAPERLQGSPETDFRSDIYSVGAVAYHLLSGRPPFTTASQADLIGQVMYAEPARLSEMVPVSAELESLVTNCLAKSSSDRPPNVDAVLEILQRLPGPSWSQPEALAWWTQKAPSLVKIPVAVRNGTEVTR